MPKFVQEARETIVELQRERATYSRRSLEWKRLNRRIAKIDAKAHHQSENWACHVAKDVVARYGVIALEDLKLVNMTKSAKGTLESPGKGVTAKSGLNRSLADAALGRLAYLRQSGGSWTQGLHSQPRQFFEGVRRLRPRRQREPSPLPVRVHTLRAQRTCGYQRRPGARSKRSGSRCAVAS
jgi:putative transposase